MDKELLTFYFTYGANHQTIEGMSLGQFYTAIEAETLNEALYRMFEARDDKFAFSYTEKEFGDQATRYNLRPITLEKVAL